MAELNLENKEFLHNIIKNLLVLPFDSACAKVAAEIYRNLKKSNKLIGVSDIFIGATAISNDLALITLNLEHFNRIKKLNIFQNGI